VDHLLGDHDRGVRRHELDAPPVALPQLVGDVEQRRRAEDPEVVDQDVDRRQSVEQRGRAVGGRDVGGGALEARVGPLGSQLGHDRIDPGTVAAVHVRDRPALGRPRRDRTATVSPRGLTTASLACVDPLTNALVPDRSICIAPLSDFAD
jgi:hypothetical protein